MVEALMRSPVSTTLVTYMQLAVGCIVHFHGARFEILSAKVRQERDARNIANGNAEFMSAKGKWLDGHIEPGYFGPTKEWHFQGNSRAKATVEI